MCSYKDCRDNFGKGHLPAGAGRNLQRPVVIGATEDSGRVLVWRMSQYERGRPRQGAGLAIEGATA